MNASETFYRHLDTCQRCRDNPFDLCIIGAIWLKKAAAENTGKFMRDNKMNANDLFEKFWAEDCAKRPLHSHPTSYEKECARRAYQAGSEAMRESIAVLKGCVGLDSATDAARKLLIFRYENPPAPLQTSQEGRK